MIDLNPADFPVLIQMPVQWGEQDAFGHVNNIHFLRWFESARIAYLMACGARMTSDSIGPILASVHCDYKKQIKFPDTVTVSAGLIKIGHSSITLEHRLWSEHQQQLLAASGHSVVVMFDYQAQKVVPVSSDIRASIARIQQTVNA